ncbi:MAG: DUF397 domain-containing protein [Actinobacteria bacterium]|nr:MAG: DUF397 domain-containing protein [Actinomycetota bacterium]
MGQNGASHAPTWRRSSRCDSHHCVEVARVQDAAAVRDSANPHQVLRFSAPAWRRFLAALQSGRFDPR